MTSQPAQRRLSVVDPKLVRVKDNKHDAVLAVIKYLREEEIYTNRQIADAQQFIECVPVLANIVQHMKGHWQALREAFEEMEFVQVQEGQTVYEAKEESDGAYLILCGKVGMLRNMRRGSLIKKTQSSDVDSRTRRTHPLAKKGSVIIRQREEIEAIQKQAPSYIKVYGEGELFGEGCFNGANPELRRLNTAVAIGTTSDTVLIKFKERSTFEAVILENRKWNMENKALFFHSSIPCFNLLYSKRFVNKNADVLSQKVFNYKHLVLEEGSNTENLMLVQEGLVLLRKR